VLDGLGSLVDNSLLRQEEQPDGQPRFTMLETIREFGLERLEAGGEAADARRRHADHFVALAEAAEPGFRGSPHQAAWLRRLEREHDNLRQALRWLDGSGDDPGAAEREGRLASALARFWVAHGHLTEGRRWLEAAAARSGAAPPALRARVLLAAGFVTWSQGDHAAARPRLEAALALFRRLGDRWGIAESLRQLGMVVAWLGEPAGEQPLFDESLALFREAGDRWGIAWALCYAGVAALRRGDADRAGDLFGESLALFRALGDPRGTAWQVDELGRVARARGDDARAEALHAQALAMFREIGERRGIAGALLRLARGAGRRGDDARARALGEEALALYRDLGDRRGVAGALCHLGEVALERGDLPRAAACLAEGLGLIREAGPTQPPGSEGTHDVGDCLAGLARVAAAARRPERAARLLGAAEAWFGARGASPAAPVRAEGERRLAALRSRLAGPALAAARAEGRAMPAEDAVSYALATAEPEAPPAPAPAAAGPPPRARLSPREEEVAALLIRGLTNRQIAAELVITERTAANHVQHLLDKLGFSTRAQVAAWAVGRGLGPAPAP
jgi:DNA-binding CsgD family transcriptional regulator/tetratricopeptide (TPR) repeat protein